MSFLNTFKKYVSTNSRSEFNDFYASRFNSEASIHIDLKINKHDAFIFVHPEISKKISLIYSLDKEVFKAFDSLPIVAQNQYLKKSLIDEVTKSNEIEGVISTRKEISDIIGDLSKNVKKHVRFLGIVNKYRMLIEDKEISIKSCNDIRAIYDDMLLDEIKEDDPNNIPDGVIFRKDIVHVLKSNDIEIHRGITPESEIIKYMDISLMFLNDTSIEPLIRIAAFHYLFGYIHPFYDGNGRINRFISSYLISKILTDISGYRLSMTVKDNLKSYYDAFKYTNDPRNMGDITTFIDAFLDIIIKSEEQTIKYAEEKKSEFNYFMHQIENLKFSQKQSKEVLSLLLQAELFSEFGLSMKDIAKISGFSKVTCLKCIEELIANNYVIETKVGRTKYYCSSMRSNEKH